MWLGRNDGALLRLTSPAPGASRAAVLDRQLALAAGLIPAFRSLSPPVDDG
jgi:hypothetical protein